MTKTEKLRFWQERLQKSRAAYAEALLAMDENERLYRGERSLRPFVEGVAAAGEAHHVRNIVAENIESLVESSIPQPRVRALRPEDEDRARLIEHLLQGELDRLHTEELNDMQERTVPIQGGGFWLIEWDGEKGEAALSLVHPKQLIPQEGVHTLSDMDYFFLLQPQTRAQLTRRYGVPLPDTAETAPDVRGLAEDAVPADELLTRCTAYYREGDRIALFSWCDETVLEDLPDCQARLRRVCAACGAADALTGEGGVCAACGSEDWQETPMAWEELWLPVETAHGRHFPGARWETDEDGEPILRPTRIPAYRPDVYPVVLQKNISLFGQLLGDSDAAKIADFQNAINWLNQKIDRRLMAAGTVITGPANADFTVDPRDHRILRLESAADKAMIDTYEFTGDVSQEFAQLAQCYEASRQVLGITDSYQGRRDETATSGKAKEFAAAQSEGRLESKRRMKEAAWARIFELLFRCHLAYADAPRPVVYTDRRGETCYDCFDRYDFLEQDEQGNYRWNDRFAFSCESTTLGGSREKLWDEVRRNFDSGAYGDPAGEEARKTFWQEMQKLHYPLSCETTE